MFFWTFYLEVSVGFSSRNYVVVRFYLEASVRFCLELRVVIFTLKLVGIYSVSGERYDRNCDGAFTNTNNSKHQEKTKNLQ